VFQAVAQAYLDVARDQGLVEVKGNNEYVLSEEFEATRIRALVGSDVAQARSSFN
jgi:hypothetical protein